MNPFTQFEPTEHPHRRLNVLTGEWILVSPHRAKRPWQGQVETPDTRTQPSYDPSCYLCPSNTRINGTQNPPYQGPFVFGNDFAALAEGIPAASLDDDGLFVLKEEQGLSRVICYSPDHSKTLPELSLAAIEALVHTWIAQYRELGERFAWVQVFENKGAINGCSNPHPHGQIWASAGVPTLPAKEDQAQRHYQQQHQRNLLQHYAARELAAGERIVCQNDHWLVVVPYWASWPFETLLLPKAHRPRMELLTDAEQQALAAILQELTCRYDNLFQCSFPYSMGWHGAPYQQQELEHWQLHAHFYPPLLRSSTVRKFMVGYEMLAETQRDLTPEQAAAMLRAQSTTHYKQAL